LVLFITYLPLFFVLSLLDRMRYLNLLFKCVIFIGKTAGESLKYELNFIF